MEDNGYSVKDRGFIFDIVYGSLLFRSSYQSLFYLLWVKFMKSY